MDMLLYTVIIFSGLLHIIRSVRLQALAFVVVCSQTPSRAAGAQRVAEGVGCLCTTGDKASGVGGKPSTSLRLTESLE
jgi:hypothetical protein